MFKLFDFSLQINGFPIKKAKAEFEKIIAISDKQFEYYVIEKRNEIVNFHLQNNSFYKNLVGKSEIENWNDLPVLTKKIYNNLWMKDFQTDILQKLSL